MNDRRRLLALILFVPACGALLPSEMEALDDVDAQAAALAKLSAETGVVWRVRWHEDVRTPAFLEGRTAPLISNPGQATAAARNFFIAHKVIFRMQEPAAELDAAPAAGDELGMTHVRFTQRKGSIPILGAEVVAHFDRDGALVRVNGRYLPLPPMDLVPAISSDVAKQVALEAARARRAEAPKDGLSAARPRLVIDPEPPARLAWEIDIAVSDPRAPARVIVHVDARTGEAWRVEESMDDIAGSGYGVFGELRPLEVAYRDGQYLLENEYGGNPVQKTYTARGGHRLPGSVVTSARADRWDDNVVGAGAAVDAHAHLATIHRYFATAHGRAGAFGDGRGVRATVHYGDRYANAFWNGRQLVFGDGDPALRVAPLAAALDVVAHEFAHAVSESSAGLGHSGEPGALNEAIADIFACFAEAYARPGRANWTVGEDVYLDNSGRAMRDLADPHRLGNPAHLVEKVRTKADRGGVHVNSTIVSHAAYLMTRGGFHPISNTAISGIGVAAAQRVWYRALLRYLGPRSDFFDAADATLAAAEDLYGAGSKPAIAVAEAWRAVGLLP